MAKINGLSAREVAELERVEDIRSDKRTRRLYDAQKVCSVCGRPIGGWRSVCAECRRAMR